MSSPLSADDKARPTKSVADFVEPMKAQEQRKEEARLRMPKKDEPEMKRIIANMLQLVRNTITEHRSRIAGGYTSPSQFDLFNIPEDEHITISLDAYVRRIVKYTNVSETTFVVAMIYLGRIQRPKLRKGRREMIVVTHRSVHKLFFVCVVLAAKFTEDRTHRQSTFGKIGGLPAEELNEMELALLRWLDWDLKITQEHFEKAMQVLACGRVASALSSGQVSISPDTLSPHPSSVN